MERFTIGERQWATHKDVRKRAQRWMSKFEFESCCKQIAAFPEYGEPTENSEIWAEEFELDREAGQFIYRFLYGYEGSNQRCVIIIGVDRGVREQHESPPGSFARWITPEKLALAASVLGLLREILGAYLGR